MMIVLWMFVLRLLMIAESREQYSKDNLKFGPDWENVWGKGGP